MGLISIGLEKTFNTINHDELFLIRMGCIQFSEKVVLYFGSYLSRRT